MAAWVAASIPRPNRCGKGIPIKPNNRPPNMGRSRGSMAKPCRRGTLHRILFINSMDISPANIPSTANSRYSYQKYSPSKSARGNKSAQRSFGRNLVCDCPGGLRLYNLHKRAKLCILSSVWLGSWADATQGGFWSLSLCLPPAYRRYGTGKYLYGQGTVLAYLFKPMDVLSNPTVRAC